MNVLRIFVVIQTVFTSVVSASWVQWSVNNHLYYISTDTKYIADARQACLNLNGYLAEVNDYQEHLFIVNFLSASHYWVGMEYDASINAWIWTNAKTPADPSIPVNAPPTSTDTGVRYNTGSGGYGLDGRQSPALYNYICEYGCPECQTSIIIQPTQTVVMPQPYTVSCQNEVTTVENVVTQVVSNGICNTDNYVTHTVMETVLLTVTETINPGSVANLAVSVSKPCQPVTVTNPALQACATAVANKNNTGLTTGLSNEELDEIVNELKVDKKSTNVFRRSLISVEDPRPSARVIGSLGIAIFVVMLICIIWVDAINMIRFLQENCRSHRH